MKNVTLSILRYREAARHLWNAYLRGEESFGRGSLPDDRTFDNWCELQRSLFDTLVLSHIDADPISGKACGTIAPAGLLRIVATSPEIPAMVSRDKPASGYWDHPVTRLTPDDDLRFVEFFDFDQSGFLDFEYYRVTIAGSPAHPDIVGHDALIEVQYAHVFAADPVTETAPPLHRG